MAGYNPNQPRDKLGEFDNYPGGGKGRGKKGGNKTSFKSKAGILTKAARAVGLVGSPRSHKKGKGGGFHLTNDPHTDAVIKASAIGLGAHAAQTALNIGISHAARKLGGDAGVAAGPYHKKSSNAKKGNPADPSWPLLGGETAHKVPNSINTTDDKGYRVKFNLEVGKVIKKKRPNFPMGYNKNHEA